MFFSDLFPTIEEYPKNIAERGVPMDTYFKYVSSTFLNGLINYTEAREGYLVSGRSGSNADDYANDMYDMEHLLAIYNTRWHGKLSIFAHAKAYIKVAILAETDHCFWLFLYDPDVSDCGIGRVDGTRLVWNEFKEVVLEYLEIVEQGDLTKLERLRGVEW